MYTESTECVGKPLWGEVKLGRIPAFIYEDAQEVFTELRPQAMEEEAATYKEKFNKAFQYYQSRCQHHVHKLVNGKRIIPNACSGV